MFFTDRHVDMDEVIQPYKPNDGLPEESPVASPVMIELKPTTQKSFGGKAMISIGEKTITLISYGTVVAKYYKESNSLKVFGRYSKTTLRHINAFADMFGFKKITKQLADSEIELILNNKTMSDIVKKLENIPCFCSCED